MQKLYWVVLLIAALATAAVGQMDDMKPKPKAKASAKMSANAATEQKLVDMEKSLWEAWKNHDSAPFQKLGLCQRNSRGRRGDGTSREGHRQLRLQGQHLFS